MDPLSLLCRLATSVPAPRFHTVRYAGVLAAASPSRAELLARTFAVDVLACPKCLDRVDGAGVPL
jgi:hypothetical protein